MPQIVNPKNSFLQFIGFDIDRDEVCCDEGQFCLPVKAYNDVKFQFRREFLTQSLAYDMARDDGAVAQLILLRGGSNTGLTVGANTLRNFFVDDGLEFVKTITGQKEVTFYWPHGIGTFTGFPYDLACDECFQLALIIQEPGETGTTATHISNCFKRVCSDCDNGVLEYVCEDDAYDFRYCNFDNAVNRIRMPMKLITPQGVTDKNVYVTSKGKWIITRSSTRQEWSGIVDFIPQRFHFALMLALEHDTCNFTSNNYEGGIRCNGGYVIDWDAKVSECIAQADFKANATPYDARNSNCKVCADCPEIVDFDLVDFHYDYGLGKQSFTFAYTIAGPAPAFVILEYKLHTDPDWTQSVQANISPINILLDLGIYDFRILPDADNCLPEYSDALESLGTDTIPACPDPAGVTVYDITTNAATAQWNAVIPTPSGLYDWQLLAADMVTVIDSGTGYWNPGTLVLALTGMDPDTEYNFQVRSNCGGGDYSDWVVFNFSTLP